MLSRSALVARAAVVGCVLAFTACGSPLEHVVRPYGYHEVRPAAEYWKPGMLVVKEGGELNPLCWQEESLGAVNPVVSDSTNSEVARKTSGDFKLEANYLDTVKAQAKASAVKSIKFTLSNVKVHTLSYATINGAYKNRSKDCTDAIARAKADKVQVSMLTSAIMADVVYAVEFSNETNVTAEVKIAQLNNLALTLGAGLKSEGQDKITGTGLFYGMRDNRGYAVAAPSSGTVGVGVMFAPPPPPQAGKATEVEADDSIVPADVVRLGTKLSAKYRGQ